MTITTVPRPQGGSGIARSARRPVLALLVAVLLGAGWFMLAPTAWGGRAAYVVTNGTSMLPHFRAGGLVVTRSEPSYHVGEVVAYHNGELHRVVMHRIVEIENNRYIFKGDNNDFRDTYLAKKSDLIGKEWIYVPGGGTWLQRARNPVIFALILAIVAFFAFRSPRRNRRRRHTHH